MYPTHVTTKTINIHRAGTGQTLQTEVSANATMRDALSQLGLVPADYDVAHPSGERLIGLDEKPWDLVTSPHDAITITPSAQVG